MIVFRLFSSVRAAAVVFCCLGALAARGQLLPSQAMGMARAQIVMLIVDHGSSGAGIIVGVDEKTVYIATAEHVPKFTGTVLPTVKVMFYGLSYSPKNGRFSSHYETQDKGDLAVVLIDRDADINKFLDGRSFALLSPNVTEGVDRPVTSFGYNGGAEWSFGIKETLLAPDQGNLRFQSDVGGGQSGGGLFNEAWELIGMPLDVGDNGVYARPIGEILDDLRKWGIPVQLTNRLAKDRVHGADEVARLRRFTAIASLSRREIESGDCVLGVRYAMSGLSEADMDSGATRPVELESLFKKGVAKCPLLNRIDAEYNAVLIFPDASEGMFDSVDKDGRWNALWNLRQKRFIAALDTKENRKGPMILFQNPSKIGVVEEDNVLRIYSANTGKVQFLLQGVSADRTDGYVNEDYNYLSVASSADGNLVAIGAPRRKIRILTLDKTRPVFEVGSDGLQAYAFSADGKRLLSGTDYPQHLQIWDVASGKELFAVDSTTNQGGAVFSPDGRHVAIWGLNGAEFWQPGIDQKPVLFSKMIGAENIDEGVGKYFHKTIFSPDGTLALVVAMYHTYVWDFTTNRLLAKVEEYVTGGEKAALLPDRSFFILEGYDPQALKVYAVSDGQLMATIPTQGEVRSIGVARDAKSIATGTENSVG